MADYNLEIKADVKEALKAIKSLQSELEKIRQSVIKVDAQAKAKIIEAKSTETLISNVQEAKGIKEFIKDKTADIYNAFRNFFIFTADAVKRMFRPLTNTIKMVYNVFTKEINLPLIDIPLKHIKRFLLWGLGGVISFTTAGIYRYVSLLGSGLNIVKENLGKITQALAEIPNITKEQYEAIKNALSKILKGRGILPISEIADTLQYIINTAEEFLENLTELPNYIQNSIKAYEILKFSQDIDPNEFRNLLQFTRLYGENIHRISAMYWELSGKMGQQTKEILLELRRLSGKASPEEIFALLEYLIKYYGINPRNVIEKAIDIFEGQEKILQLQQLEQDVNNLFQEIASFLDFQGTIDDLISFIQQGKILLKDTLLLKSKELIAKYNALIEANLTSKEILSFQQVQSTQEYYDLLMKYSQITAENLNKYFEKLISVSPEASTYYNLLQMQAYIKNILSEYVRENYLQYIIDVFESLRTAGNIQALYGLFDIETGLPNTLGNLVLGISQLLGVEADKVGATFNGILEGIKSVIETIKNILEVGIASLQHIKNIDDTLKTVKGVFDKDYALNYYARKLNRHILYPLFGWTIPIGMNY